MRIFVGDTLPKGRCVKSGCSKAPVVGSFDPLLSTSEISAFLQAHKERSRSASTIELEIGNEVNFII